MDNRPKPETARWTILGTLEWTASYFKSRGLESPRASAEILLAHVLGINRIDLYLRYDQPLSSRELADFKTLIKRRASGEPVAYIIGEKEFWSITLSVTTDVLIPRPETECLVERAITLLPTGNPVKPLRVLDLGTGSGAIILALASERPGHHYYACDKSLEALRLARKSAADNNLDSQVEFYCGDWLSPVKENCFFDLIVSNPPYIPTNEIDNLQIEISKFEPRVALDGGADGLLYIKTIIDSACERLSRGGVLLLEIGHDQKNAVERITTEHGGYESVEFTKDYSGIYRNALMRKR